MIDADHELSLTRQAELLALSRSSLYYQPVPVSDADLALMRRIDELHLELPFAGSRLLRDLLQGEGHAIGRKRVRRLMRTMGISAIYRRQNTSRRHPGIRCSRICCAALPSTDRTRCGRRTSPRSRWRGASSTWWR
jgi:putative transposase